MSTIVLLPTTPTSVPAPPWIGSLRVIEQGVAAQLGPFALFQVASATGADVVVDGLQSTIVLGGWQDLWVLRRDATTPTDRLARVKAYTPSLGQLTVDRTYDDPPSPGEELELHHLDPATLRRAVRAGLARCHLQCEVALVDPSTGAPLPVNGSLDLTALTGTSGWSWLRDPAQVLDVVASDSAQGWNGYPLQGWRAWGSAGHVYLSLAPISSPGVGPVLMATTTVTAVCHRPHSTWVNDADAPDGPTNDDDVLAVAVDLAVAAGAIEAWRIARPQLEAVAAEGRQATQQECAAEFTRLAVAHQPWLFVTGGAAGAGGRPDRIGPLTGLPGLGPLPALTAGSGVVINGPGAN